MLLELHLYERIIEGKDLPITPGEAKQVEDGRWDKFCQNKTVQKYLAMIRDLQDLHKTSNDRERLTTQEFAN